MNLPRIAAVVLSLACASCAPDRRTPSMAMQDCEDQSVCEQDCAMGNGLACRQLARQHELGIGTQVDVRKAVRLYQRGCGAGDSSSCVSAAGYLRDGLPAVAEPVR